MKANNFDHNHRYIFIIDKERKLPKIPSFAIFKLEELIVIDCRPDP